MNVSFEDVRSLIDRWIEEAAAHMAITFPHVSRETLYPVIREQVIKAVGELLNNKLVTPSA